MVSQTNEKALEACIERALTGSVGHPVADDGSGFPGEVEPIYGPHAGYVQGHPADFDREFAVDRAKFWEFLEQTQPHELAKLSDRTNWQRLILERLSRKIKKDGVLSILKKGLAIDDARFILLYSLPYNDANPEVAANFETNIFSVTRQVHYAQTDPSLSIDMVVFINGLPVATMELKNPWTGQSAYHAKQQYCRDRDPAEPLLQFGRCLVHFAVDTDEVYMTTRLAKEKTYFLPFNKGHNFGRGNPPNPKGHKTAYLWEEVLTRQSLTNIVEHFAKRVTEKDDQTGKKQKILFFPRYHQLDVVRKLLTHAKAHSAGHKYLIQHSAGSGKSHSITWSAYQLIELFAQGADRPLFDSVVVVTDRRVLDRQLRDNIKQFTEVKNIVAHAESAQGLKRALEKGKRIIITTIQKFPYIIDGIEDLSHRRFAVIIDEAHSSQGGKAADNLNVALGAAEDDEAPVDTQAFILKTMEDRRMGANASFFAFTATPKNATLEKFCEPNAAGKFEPFHLYAMKQAIEEEFILDVLANYTTYKSYYQIQKSIRDNPLFNTAKAQKKLRAYVEGHRETIAVKAEIMVNHFMSQVSRKKKLKGRAKAMVVTRNITTAVRYYFAVRQALRQTNAPFEALVAFSGKKKVDGVEYSEEKLNGFPGKDIPKTFKKDKYKILVVANKYITGFDEPLLHTMYVDKKLQHVLAVQTLSRLNRCNKAMGKNDTFVLDFFNNVKEIKDAFDPFYTATTLSEPTDVNVLHDLKEHLDEVGVYDWHEVETFNDLFFNDADADLLSPIIDTAADRFDHELELEEEIKVTFKIQAKQFVKIYAQIACIIPFNNVQWEMLHWFLKFLIPKLKVRDPNRDRLDALLNSVDLTTYGVERVKINQNIDLDASPTEVEPQNPNPRGHHGEPQSDPLDEIIKVFNERFFSGWEATPDERRAKFINITSQVMNDPNFQTHYVDNQDSQNRRLAIERMISLAVNKERRRELELYKRYASDPEFKRAFDASIMHLLAKSDQETLKQLMKK